MGSIRARPSVAISSQLVRYTLAPVTPPRALTTTIITSSLLAQPWRTPAASQRRQFSTTTAINSSSPPTSKLRRTPLDRLHEQHAGKMVDFAGWRLPVSYGGVGAAASHRHTRTPGRASIFDVSHMVQQTMRGPRAGLFLERCTPIAARTMRVGTAALTLLLNHPHGGIVDDAVVARVGDAEWYVVTNAGRREADAQFWQDRLAEMAREDGQQQGEGRPQGVEWIVADDVAMLALQGPAAADVLRERVKLSDGRSVADALCFGEATAATMTIGSRGDQAPLTVEVMVSRGGYTGEDGFELGMIPAKHAEDVVNELLSHKASTTSGQADDANAANAANTDPVVQLAGLGARDSLRLEAGLCLYGHDLDETVTPIESALMWTIPRERRSPDAQPAFPGRTRILELTVPRSKGGPGVERRRVGLVVENGPAAREGAVIVTPRGEDADNTNGGADNVIGKITSGCPSPTLGQNIAMGYVKDGLHKVGTELEVLVRGKRRKAVVTKMPFVETKYVKRS